RAGASNRTMVAALGVNVRLLYTLVFGFGAALAALGGLMAGPIYTVQPGMGDDILIQVLVVIVIGGIGSIRGALVGAVVVGMVDTLGRAFLKPMLATVLRPSAAESAGRALAVAAGLATLALVPLAAAVLNQPFYLDHFRRIMIFAIAALSLDLILGYGGMVSFGHAAYLGIGAYAVGVLTHHGVQNGFVPWGAAVAGSAVVALAIGAVSIRTSGVSFIMITLAFTQMQIG